MNTIVMVTRIAHPGPISTIRPVTPHSSPHLNSFSSRKKQMKFMSNTVSSTTMKPSPVSICQTPKLRVSTVVS